MKKLLFLLLAILLSFNMIAMAQERGYKIGLFGAYNQYPIIESNKQTSSGVKLVRGSKFIPTVKNSSVTEKSELSYLLGMSVSTLGNDSLSYTVDVKVITRRIDGLYTFKDSPLLIKLNDDEVIRLYCKEDVKDEVGELVSLTYNIREYTIIPQYRITLNDIQKLKKGIKKIRLEVNAEKRDFEFRKYKKDEVGAFLFNEYELITKSLFSQTSFDEDF